ncbi:hypothetical protein OZY32_02325 [Aliarcobacter cryaerophilus]|uniref:hypothetical protein n=1 Tax=Aliarcobacter cryaerophilus TaxID=28198 RepID=UPI003BAFC00A
MIEKINRNNFDLFSEILESWTVVTHELTELSQEIKNITNEALREIKLRQYRLKVNERAIYKKLLIQCLKLLTNVPKKDKINIITSITVFLKNIFGHNNSSETHNNK